MPGIALWYGCRSADTDGDGWQDLFVANIDQELFSLYQNQKACCSSTNQARSAGDTVVKRMGSEVSLISIMTAIPI